MNKRACRYGASCRNPTCVFSHDAVSAPQHNSYGGGPSSAQPCRYGASCKRQDCRFSHVPSTSSAPYHSSLQSSSAAPSSSSLVPCRFGDNCTAPNCRFYHDDEEFSPEEEERIDEILDMIEQEQRAREGNTDDAEDDKNIDEIFAYIQNQQGSNPQLDDFSLPDEADDEYEAMMQQHQHYQQPFYGYQPQDELLAQMNNLNMKGMSAQSAPFVPGTQR